MKKKSSSGASKAMILSIGLALVAVLAVAVIWSTQFMQRDVPVPKTPTAKRMKISQTPAATRMKIPQPPPRIEQPQPDAKPMQAQPSGPTSDDSETPESEATESEETPSQHPVASQQGEPQAPIDQSGTPADKDTVVAQTVVPPAPTSPTAAQIAVPQEVPHDTAASADTPEPMLPVVDAPADGALAQEKAVETPPQDKTTVDAVVVAPSAPPPTRVAEMNDTASARFNLQLGAYRVEAYAHEAVAKIAKKGYDAFIVEITDARQNTWHTVRIGRYTTREEASSSLNRFKQKERINAVIARSGKL